MHVGGAGGVTGVADFLGDGVVVAGLVDQAEQAVEEGGPRARLKLALALGADAADQGDGPLEILVFGDGVEFLKGIFYRTRLVSYDQQSGRGECLRLWQSFGFFSRPRSTDDLEPGWLPGPAPGVVTRPITGAEYALMSRGTSLPYGPDDHMSLDLCVCTVDGHQALFQRLSGGSAVVLAAGSPGVFRGHHLPAITHDATSAAAELPTREIEHGQARFLLVTGQHVWERFRAARAAHTGEQRVWPIAEEGRLLEREASFRDVVAAIIARRELESALDNDDDDVALVDEQHLRLWDGAVNETCSCRLFPGSAVTLAVATIRGRFGFHCMMGVAEHVEACKIAVACLALGGGMVAFPVARERRASGNTSGLRFKPWAAATHEWFAAGDDCVLSCSGISAHCVLDGVRHSGSPKSGCRSVDTTCFNPALAEIQGHAPRLETQHGEPNIGCWANADARLLHRLLTDHAGPRRLALRYALATDSTGSTGSAVDLVFTWDTGEHRVRLEPETTGAWSAFRTVDPGVLDLPAGSVNLRVVPAAKPGLAVINLGPVTLTPSDS